MKIVMKEILLGVSVLTWFGFLLHSWYRIGIQYSISALYYRLSTRGTKRKLKFFLIYMFSAMPLVGYAMTLDLPETGVDIKVLIFFAGVFFAAVGVAPDYYRKSVEVIHNVFAIGAIVLGLVFMTAVAMLTNSLVHYILVGSYVMFVILFWVLRPIKNSTTWVELAAYIVLVLGLLMI